jgi:hypothetical protein
MRHASGMDGGANEYDLPPRCDFDRACSGDPVARTMYDTWCSGWVGPYGLCQWHLHSLFTTTSSMYSAISNIWIEPLDPLRPWLPPGVTEVSQFYRGFGHGPYGPELLPDVDWDAWHPDEPAYVHHGRVRPPQSESTWPISRVHSGIYGSHLRRSAPQRAARALSWDRIWLLVVPTLVVLRAVMAVSRSHS